VTTVVLLLFLSPATRSTQGRRESEKYFVLKFIAVLKYLNLIHIPSIFTLIDRFLDNCQRLSTTILQSDRGISSSSEPSELHQPTLSDNEPSAAAAGSAAPLAITAKHQQQQHL
jgi:hypothetical protein